MGNGTSPKDAIEGIPSQEELVEHIKKTRPTFEQTCLDWFVGILRLFAFLYCEYSALSILYRVQNAGLDCPFGFGWANAYLAVFSVVAIATNFPFIYFRGRLVDRGLIHEPNHFNDQVYCFNNGVVYVFGAPRSCFIDFVRMLRDAYGREAIFCEELAKEVNAWTAFRLQPKDMRESSGCNATLDVLSGKVDAHGRKVVCPEEKRVTTGMGLLG